MVKSLSMFFHSLYWYHKSMKTKPLKAIRQTRRLQKNYIMPRINLVLNFEKIGRRFGSSKRTLINNPPERIHELYFMPTDLQRCFYEKGEQADTSERVGIFRAGEAHRQILKQKSLLKVGNDSMGYEWKPNESTLLSEMFILLNSM